MLSEAKNLSSSRAISCQRANRNDLPPAACHLPLLLRKSPIAADNQGTETKNLWRAKYGENLSA